MVNVGSLFDFLVSQYSLFYVLKYCVYLINVLVALNYA